MTAYTVLIATERNPEFTLCRPKLPDKSQAEAYARHLRKSVPAVHASVRTQPSATPNAEFMAGRLWWD